PSGNKHDYLSWAPYWWPDCSGVGNTTELTPQEIWVTCPYKDRDGVFVPDYRLINDTGSFAGMADAVMFNALAWQITGDDKYANKSVEFISTWYLDEDTYMAPNLNYSQVKRGPGVQQGNKSGVLDMKNTAKILSAILLFRKTSYPGWTAEKDTKMRAWSAAFIQWLETHPFGKQEMASANNHGTFWYNTMVSHQIIVNNASEAKRYLNQYYTTQFLKQIDANGEQPLEVVRSRTYHYRAYNIGAMVTCAKLAAYIGMDTWNLTTTNGGTIQTALDWAMSKDPAATHEVDSAPKEELYQDIAAVGAHYGDGDGKYAHFLAGVDPEYPKSPYFLWNQPLALPEGYVVGAGKLTLGQAVGSAQGTIVPTLGTLVVGIVTFQLARTTVAQRV
ncbi:chondroitin AC/alginate lyase, partial [Exidia glandulosa HHB12029]